MWTPRWLRRERQELKDSIEEAERLQDKLDKRENYVNDKYIEFTSRLKRNDFERALRNALKGRST